MAAPESRVDPVVVREDQRLERPPSSPKAARLGATAFGLFEILLIRESPPMEDGIFPLVREPRLIAGIMSRSPPRPRI